MNEHKLLIRNFENYTRTRPPRRSGRRIAWPWCHLQLHLDKIPPQACSATTDTLITSIGRAAQANAAASRRLSRSAGCRSAAACAIRGIYVPDVIHQVVSSLWEGYTL